MGLLFFNFVNMAVVYILYSKKADSFYIGSCNNLEERLKQHSEKMFTGFTSKQNDWELHYSISDLKYNQARSIETHFKKMKSRKYLQNLILFPDITTKLILKYKT
jgi:putative endonuclease